MEYRRIKTKGGTFFFTVVTHDRRPFLCQTENINLLRMVMTKVMKAHPLVIDAIVVLPDHIHAIWTLPKDDDDYSIRWSLIKSGFSRSCDSRYKGDQTRSRILRKEQAVWQHRFWEHQIRDEDDLRRHIEYIHFNPVKHGYVARPSAWKFSSFNRYVRNGMYPIDWGVGGIGLTDRNGKE